MQKPWLVAVGLFLLDQLTKFYVASHYALGTSLPIIENIFHLTYILNPGAAFSLLEHQMAFFIGVNIALFAAGAYYYRRLSQGSAFLRYGVALLFGGAIGNLVDRLRLGAVIDFFDWRIWPVFNVADIGICVGVALIMYDIAFLQTD